MVASQVRIFTTSPRVPSRPFPVDSEVRPLNLQKLPMMGLMPMCNHQRSPRYKNSGSIRRYLPIHRQRPQLQQLAEAARALMDTNSASEERFSGTGRV